MLLMYKSMYTAPYISFTTHHKLYIVYWYTILYIMCIAYPYVRIIHAF